MIGSITIRQFAARPVSLSPRFCDRSLEFQREFPAQYQAETLTTGEMN
jgi:hypothetical protein